MIAVNLRAPFLLARPHDAGDERARLRPRAVHVLGRGLTGGIVGPHYAASKAGLHGLTHYLARPLAPATA